MAKIPTYQEGSNTPQLGQTAKIPVSGSPVAQSLTQLGKGIQDVAVVFQEFRDAKQKSMQFDTITASMEKEQMWSQNYEQARIAPQTPPEFLNDNGQIISKAEYISGQRNEWLQDIQLNWGKNGGSDYSLKDLQSTLQRMSIQNDGRYKAEDFKREGEAIVYNATNAGDIFINQANQAKMHGRFDEAESYRLLAKDAYSPADKIIGIGTSDKLLQQGSYSAMRGHIRSSETIEDVNAGIKAINESVNDYSPEQLASLKLEAGYRKDAIESKNMSESFALADAGLKQIKEQVAQGIDPADTINMYADAMEGKTSPEMIQNFRDIGVGLYTQKTIAQLKKPDMTQEEYKAKALQSIKTESPALAKAIKSYTGIVQKAFSSKKEKAEAVGETIKTINGLEYLDPNHKAAIISWILREQDNPLAPEKGIHKTSDIADYQSLISSYEKYTLETGDMSKIEAFSADLIQLLNMPEDKRVEAIDVIKKKNADDANRAFLKRQADLAPIRVKPMLKRNQPKPEADPLGLF